MLFPFRGPFLNAIMGGGGGGYIHICQARYRKNNRFQLKEIRRAEDEYMGIHPQLSRYRNGPVPLIKRLNLPGLNGHMAEFGALSELPCLEHNMLKMSH
jgi:hypothetical protein